LFFSPEAAGGAGEASAADVVAAAVAPAGETGTGGMPADGPYVRLPAGGIPLEEAERQLIVQALERSGWVQKEAARMLGLSSRALNYRVQRLGITHAGWRKNREP
jgi:transcriptional regulator of acetoin/glycerol metabolism